MNGEPWPPRSRFFTEYIVKITEHNELETVLLSIAATCKLHYKYSCNKLEPVWRLGKSNNSMLLLKAVFQSLFSWKDPTMSEIKLGVINGGIKWLPQREHQLTCRTFLAAKQPMETWSSVPALVLRESTDAGWLKVLFSDTKNNSRWFRELFSPVDCCVTELVNTEMWRNFSKEKWMHIEDNCLLGYVAEQTDNYLLTFQMNVLTTSSG